MARNYFNLFPEITYNGYKCKNVIASTTLVDKYVNTPYIFYSTYLENDLRADHVSNEYYDDPYMTWALYFANKMKDPYYDWTLTYNDFNKFIADKYGSIEKAQKTILYFRTNWYSDNRELSRTQFNAFFGDYKDPHSKYWQPQYNPTTGQIISYIRKQEDVFVQTNKIIKLGVANNVNSANTSKLVINDLIDIKENGAQKGTATVEFANTTVVFLKHVLGDIANTYNLHLDNTNTYCTITSYNSEYNLGEPSWTKTNISEEEYIYWEPVYAYDEEDEINTLKKTINLLDGETAYRIHDKMEDLLKE